MIKLEINGGTDLQPKLWLFPAGEVGIQLPVIHNDAKLKLVVDYPSSDEVLQMFNIFDALKKLNFNKNNVELVLKYFPYARQDRVCKGGESFALELFCNMLKNFGHFSVLTTWDLHSSVSEKLLDCTSFTVQHLKQHDIAKSLSVFNFLIAPDKGAVDKVKLHKQVQSLRTDVLYFEKGRTDTGIVYPRAQKNIYQGRACVVDDICDGGETFLQLGKMLKETQPDLELSLYITHGIFSNPEKFKLLSEIYDTIYVGTLMHQSYKSLVKELQ